MPVDPTRISTIKTVSKKRNMSIYFLKGVHIIVPNFSKKQRVLNFIADDGRPFFVIPMGDRLCIGTTDTPVEKPSVGVKPGDRRFILENINKRLSLSPALSLDDIIAERCGVRPLVIDKAKQNEQGKQGWISLSRKHVIETDKKELSYQHLRR